MRRNLLVLSCILALSFTTTSFAAYGLTFVIPENGNIIGGMQTAIVQQGESLGDIGRKFDVGVYEMIEANPSLDPWSPYVGAKVIIPTKFILPVERNGIVINLAEMRLYYFHPKAKLVTTHPIGIGLKGRLTPLAKTAITQKKKDPIWYPTASIRESNRSKGNILPTRVFPGPKNPLGKYAMKLALPGYLIHGTNRPGGVGVRSSSGCIRMFPEDIEALFNKVAIGTSVTIVHKPYKIGSSDNEVYVEAHQPLSDAYYNGNAQPSALAADLELLMQAFRDSNIPAYDFYLSKIKNMQILTKPNGYPVKISPG